MEEKEVTTIKGLDGKPLNDPKQPTEAQIKHWKKQQEMQRVEATKNLKKEIEWLSLNKEYTELSNWMFGEAQTRFNKVISAIKAVPAEEGFEQMKEDCIVYVEKMLNHLLKVDDDKASE